MIEKHVTPLKAIRAKCLECCAGSAHEVKLCHISDCALWVYRMGRNPRRAGLGGHPPEAQKTRAESAKAE